MLFSFLGMTKKDLEHLPTGISMIFKDVMHRCRERPPSTWPKEIYQLVDRQDLAELEKHSSPSNSELLLIDEKSSITKEPEPDDGMDFDDNVSYFFF